MRWKTAQLGKVATVLSGSTPNSFDPLFWNGKYIWITPTDLGKLVGRWIEDSERHLTGAGIDSCNLTRVPQNAVVMSSRAPIGHLGIAARPLFTNQGCKSFVCSDDIDPHFLYYALRFRMADVRALGSGATFSEVSKSVLEKFEISFPKIDEQKRIASLLENQMSELETAKQATEQQQRDAKRLFESLHKETSSFLSEMKVVPLGSLLSGIEAGKSFQTLERIAQNNEMGVLKVSAVSWTEFRPNEAKAIDRVYVPQDKHRVGKGDILISRANTVELVGAVVQVDRDYPNRLLSDKTLRLIPDAAKILPDFLLRVLRLPEARAYIENNATGTSDSMRNISQKTILAIPIRVPELSIQQSIVQRFLAIENESKRMNTAFGAISENMAILPSKLLSAAFEI